MPKNWLSKLCQSKPMPLPFRGDGIRDKLPIRDQKGWDNIDHTMSQETANSEANYGPEFLGSGAHGIATTAPSNTVKKYTTRRSEAAAAKMIMQNPRDHLVKIITVDQIQTSPNLWSIQMERCKTLNELEKRVINATENGEFNQPRDFRKFLNNAIFGKHLTPQELDDPNILNHIELLYLQFCAVWKDATTIGLGHPDASANNVGWNSNGDLVLFDLSTMMVELPLFAHCQSPWLTKISQAKPMPFPVSPPEREETEGWDKIHTRMTQETSDTEHDKFPDQQWLGSGKYGVATECEPGMVCKYTVDETEARTAMKVMDKYYPGVAQVFDVQMVQEEPNIFMIKSEKCVGLNEEQWLIVDKIYTKSSQDIFRRGFTTQGLYPIEAVMKDFERELRLERITVAEITKMYHDYIRLLETLTGSGFSLVDTHGANIGYNPRNELVLFDLGGSED